MSQFIPAVSEWVRRLAYLVLAVTFLELLAPENKMKPLVKVVIGFFITAAIVMPVVNWLRAGRGFEAYDFFNQPLQSQGGTTLLEVDQSGLGQASVLYRSAIQLESERLLLEAGIPATVSVNWSPETGVTKVLAQVKEGEDLGQVVDALAGMLSIDPEKVHASY